MMHRSKDISSSWGGSADDLDTVNATKVNAALREVEGSKGVYMSPLPHEMR